jgi:hypothetical protein
VSSPTEPPDEWFDWYMPEDQDGAWQCGAGHMFRYEPPPASPPWCFKPDCHAGNFRWIIKDEVTSQDWLPDEEPPTVDDPDEERREVEQRYIDQLGQLFQIEMKLPTPKPVSSGLAQQVDFYGTEIHQQIEKHYTDMVHRNPDGSDPLVEEPGP